MANIIENDAKRKEFRECLSRLLQSGNINFILGSGASYPAIPVAGNVEQDIKEHLEKGNVTEANSAIYQLLNEVQNPNSYFDKEEKDEFQEKVDTTLGYYKEFIRCLEGILVERKSSLIPRQANVFTTNYDLFLEKASESYPAINFNDGFVRTLNISGKYEFSSRNFFNAIYNKGNLYNYKVEIPTINFIKIHGSLSWSKDDDKILFCRESRDGDNSSPEAVQKFNDSFSLILPKQDKFRETIMDRTYYDLLRIFANELDKENTVLVSFGFSFLDEHIRDVTVRALKNPTLKLIAFAFDNDSVASLEEVFSGYSNVDIIAPIGDQFNDFSAFNLVLDEVLNPPDDKEEEEEQE